jgi:hypothetical protein
MHRTSIQVTFDIGIETTGDTKDYMDHNNNISREHVEKSSAMKIIAVWYSQ